MIGWITRIFSGTKGEILPEGRHARNEWIKAKFKEWQTQWHELYNIDQSLIDAGEFDLSNPLPNDIDTDFRLICGFSHATSETRQKCLALFPEGQEMYCRFENFLSRKPIETSEAAARNKLQEVILLVGEIGPNEEVDFSHISVIDRDTPEGLKELEQADNITVLLEENLGETMHSDGLLQLAASLFLTEPLYASAGNFYYVRDWVTSAMIGGKRDRLNSLLYELWLSGWEVHLDQKGVLLVKRST